jgi:hypothetical protein
MSFPVVRLQDAQLGLSTSANGRIRVRLCNGRQHGAGLGRSDSTEAPDCRHGDASIVGNDDLG